MDMKRGFIVIIGTYNSDTTEQIPLKEMRTDATDVYEAHKIAYNKCNLKENQTVLRITDLKKIMLFDFFSGFVK